MMKTLVRMKIITIMTTEDDKCNSNYIIIILIILITVHLLSITI